MIFRNHTLNKIRKDQDAMEELAIEYLEGLTSDKLDGLTRSIPIRKKAKADYQTAIMTAQATQDAQLKMAEQIAKGKKTMDFSGPKSSTSPTMVPVNDNKTKESDELQDIIDGLGDDNLEGVLES